MSKKRKDEQETSINQDAIIDLANSLVKSENTFDIGAIMRMATNLLSNDSMMKSVQEIGQANQEKEQKDPDMGQVNKAEADLITMNPVADIGQFNVGLPLTNDPFMSLFQGISQLGMGASQTNESVEKPEPNSETIPKEKTTSGSSKVKESPPPNTGEFAMIKEQLARIANDLSVIKNELRALKTNSNDEKAGKKQKKKK